MAASTCAGGAPDLRADHPHRDPAVLGSKGIMKGKAGVPFEPFGRHEQRHTPTCQPRSRQLSQSGVEIAQVAALANSHAVGWIADQRADALAVAPVWKARPA